MRLTGALGAALGLAAIAVTASALWMPVKARLAQHLLHRAWAAAEAGEARPRPWPWADSWPVARLRLPGRGIDLIVMAGASGSSLAFGPGHLDGTAPPGEPGNSVIGGHRDTSLAFLRDVKPGEYLQVDTLRGRTVTYRIDRSAVVDASRVRSLPDAPWPMLTLVTCYPFDTATTGGTLRYLVYAEAVLEMRGPGSI
jgi:sortase A